MDNQANEPTAAYNQPLNFDKVWSMFQEVAKSQQKTEELIKGLTKESKKTDEQLAKTDKQLAKTDEQLSKTDVKLAKIAKMYGGVANNQGLVAEEFFYNSLNSTMILGGIKYDYIEKNVTRKHKKIEDEYDILLIGKTDIFIIEVKYKLHKRDLDRFANIKYPNFKKLYPEYANHNHKLALASFHIDDDIKNDALDLGISILQRKGNVIETIFAE